VGHPVPRNCFVKGDINVLSKGLGGGFSSVPASELIRSGGATKIETEEGNGLLVLLQSEIRNELAAQKAFMMGYDKQVRLSHASHISLDAPFARGLDSVMTMGHHILVKRASCPCQVICKFSFLCELQLPYL
jgi:hypothetical protein